MTRSLLAIAVLSLLLPGLSSLAEEAAPSEAESPAEDVAQLPALALEAQPECPQPSLELSFLPEAAPLNFPGVITCSNNDDCDACLGGGVCLEGFCSCFSPGRTCEGPVCSASQDCAAYCNNVPGYTCYAPTNCCLC